MRISKARIVPGLHIDSTHQRVGYLGHTRTVIIRCDFSFSSQGPSGNVGPPGQNGRPGKTVSEALVIDDLLGMMIDGMVVIRSGVEQDVFDSRTPTARHCF